MRIKWQRLASIVLVLSLILSWPSWGLTREIQLIDVQQALKLAFEQSPSFSVFLWELEIKEQKARKSNFPRLEVSLTPSELENGIWQNPRGQINLRLPLGAFFDLGGSLSLELDQKGLQVIPVGSVSLNYNFFAREEAPQASSPQRDLQNQKNHLVLMMADHLIGLRTRLDQEKHLQKRYEYLQESLWAASLTPVYDDLKLKAELRELAGNLGALREEIELLQLKLRAQLQTEETHYEPVIRIGPDQFVSDFELYLKELFAFDNDLNRAQEALKIAEGELIRQKRSGGWDLEAGGKINLDATWQVGLVAKKSFFPQDLKLEELELALAKARLSLREQELNLQNQLKEALQRINSARANIELQAEHLQEAEEDLELIQRQFQVGLVTALTLKEAQLQMEKARLESVHAQYAYAQSILRLYALCGRDLEGEIRKIF